MKNLILPVVLMSGLVMTGCTNTGAKYEPINDGQLSVAYTSDLSDCQKLATSRGYINDDTKTNAMIGAGLGALAGIADDDVNDTEGALTGAVVGAIAGAGATMIETRSERSDIVVKCMQARGHSVVG